MSRGTQRRTVIEILGRGRCGRGKRLGALLVFRNELVNRRDKFHRDIHNRRLRYAGLVFSNGLFFRLRFVVFENATYALLIRTGGKSRLFHRCFLRCLRRYYRCCLALHFNTRDHKVAVRLWLWNVLLQAPAPRNHPPFTVPSNVC